MEDILNKLLQEEQDLQFERFDEDAAWELGSAIVRRSIAENLSITIDITRGGRQVFHAARPGTSPDNDEWVKRKTRLAYRFEHSSFYIGQALKSKGKTLEEAYLISEKEFAAHGGCFPVLIKGVGMVGTVTVSGLPQSEDHRIVVEEIKKYLERAG